MSRSGEERSVTGPGTSAEPVAARKRGPKFANAIDPESEDFQYFQWPFYGIVRVTGRYHLRLDALLKTVGMDVSRWRVLMMLASGRPVTVTQIADEAVIKMSTMAKIIQRMAAQDLVVTRTSAADARATEVLITPSGRRALVSIRTKVARVSADAFRGVTEADLRALNAITRRIHDNLSG